MMAELGKLADEPGCPVLMRAIVANIYRDLGRYDQAIALWGRVLESPASSDERDRARRQIALLSALKDSRR